MPRAPAVLLPLGPATDHVAATHVATDGDSSMLLAVGGWASITSPTRTTQRAARRGDALLRAVPTAMVGVEDILRFSKYDQRREQASTATLQPVELPTVDGRVDGPLVQTLATVCRKLYDHSLQTVFKPVDAPVNDKLEQPYELVKAGGEYNEGGTYTANGVYTNGKGALVSGYDIFNKDTTQVVDGKTCGTASLASYGKVIDGFTDFHGEDQAAIPPFAALIVQPKNETSPGWRVVRQAVRSEPSHRALLKTSPPFSCLPTVS